MAISKDPEKRARQLANLQPGAKNGPGHGGIPKGYVFAPKHFGVRCALCDGEFVAETSKQRFCSPQCRAEGGRLRAILAGRDPRYVSVAARLGSQVQTGSAIGRTLARVEQLRQPPGVGS